MGLKSAILTPTYCGRDILRYYFQSALEHNIKPDMFLFVVKRCQSTQKDSILTINEYKDVFGNFVIIKYGGEYGLIKQILLGLNVLAKLGVDVVIFTDDDTYFIDNKYLDKYLAHYNNDEKIGGVAGRIIDTKITKDNRLIRDEGIPSIPPKRLYLWRRPALDGIYQTYFTKGGYVAVWGNDTYHVNRGTRLIPSLLGGGSNMSIRLAALGSLLQRKELLPNMYIGQRYEQVLAYHIVKNKYKVIKDYTIATLHLFRETGETRAPRPSRRATLTASDEFIFYYLKNLYSKDFSSFYHLISIFQRLFRHVVREPRLSPGSCRIETLIGRILGQMFGNVVGLWYLLSTNKDYLYKLFEKFEKMLTILDKCMTEKHLHN